nr:MAG TPA: zinc finger protein [Bacteriophage sp.]
MLPPYFCLPPFCPFYNRGHIRNMIKTVIVVS